jgi:hypothetical protein
LPRNADQLDPNAKRLSKLRGNGSVVAFDLHLGIQRSEGRKVLEDADLDRSGGGDVVKHVGLGRADGREGNRRGKGEAKASPGDGGHVHSPRLCPALWRVLL